MRLRVERLLPDGTALAGGFRLRGVVPGELVEVSPEGRLLKILEPSPFRQEGCHLLGRCPGCPWGHITPQGQAQFKRELVKEYLGEEPELWQGSQWGWRWRAKFLVKRAGEMLYVGLKLRRKLIFDLWRCPLMPEPLNKVLEGAKWVLKEEGVSVYNPDTGRGKLVALELVGSPDPPGLVLALHTRLPVRSRLLGSKLAKVWKGLTGVAEVHHEEVLGLWGEVHYRLRLGSAIYRMSPGKPWCENPEAHRALAERVFEVLYPQEAVFEAGAARFFLGLIIAQKSKRVLSADPSPWDFSDGPGSLNLNPVGNLDLTHEQIRDFVEKGEFSVYIINLDRDPPEPETMGELMRAGAKQVILLGENLEFFGRVDGWTRETGFKRKTLYAFDVAPGSPRVLVLAVYSR